MQWIKNLFVLAGITFASGWDHPPYVTAALILFVAFSALASSVYIFNDYYDRDHDQQHPNKCQRPLTAKTVSIRTALLLAVFLSGCALGAATLISLTALWIFISYLGLNIFYTVWLKHHAGWDILCIASGFVLRVCAGTWGIGLVPSVWLLLCTFGLALMLALGKRYAELHRSDNKALTRTALLHYSHHAIKPLLFFVATATWLSYALYNMKKPLMMQHTVVGTGLVMLLVTMGFTRYLWLVYKKNEGENPAALVIKDKYLLSIISLWIALVLSYAN